MKHIFLTLTLNILGIYSFAQVNSENTEDDTTKINLGKTQIIIIESENVVNFTKSVFSIFSNVLL